MPELPEVEMVRRYLEENIIKNKINNVVLFVEKSAKHNKKREFDKLIDQKIIAVDRIAKYLIIKCERNYLVLHLRMEGKINFIKSKKEMYKINKNHLILTIETNKGIIVFKDFRKFATVDLFDNDLSYDENFVLSKLGKEPFTLSAEELYSSLKNKRIAIKSALLDQKIISGLGNIYVNEVLFECGLYPEIKSNLITIEMCKEIIKHSRIILNNSIKLGGTSIHSFTYGNNVEGGYFKKLKVHGQNECKKCKRTIKKIKVGGRGTYYCPKCQIPF